MRVLNQMGVEFADAVAQAFPDIEVVEAPLAGDVAPDLAGDVLLASHASDTVVELSRRVPWVHFTGTGVDRVPREVLRRPVVTCTRGANAVPIAEYVLLALLAAEKDAPSLWIRSPPEHWFLARLGTLEDRALGLVGFGGIGQAVARRGLGFGMRVRALRRHHRPPEVDGVAVVTDLHELMGWADHLVVAAPSTARTHHIIDAAALAAARPGLHLVNVARGSLVDQNALRTALDTGRVGLATLDVADPEPVPPGHWLYTHPRVRLSPHVSWSSPALLRRATDQAVENIRRRRAGQPLLGVVDPSEGY